MSDPATQTGRPGVAVAAFLLSGLVALAATALGWRWSLDWPRTPGEGAISATAGALLFASLLLGRAWLANSTSAWAGMAGAVVLLQAASIVEPTSTTAMPGETVAAALWLIALHRLSLRLPRLSAVAWPMLAALLIGVAWVDSSGFGQLTFGGLTSTSSHRVGSLPLLLPLAAVWVEVLAWRGRHRRDDAVRHARVAPLSTQA